MRGKKAVKNISFSIIQQLTAILCGFIVPKLIISNYGSSVNGLISSITQFLAYISFLEAGVGPVVKSILYKPIAKKNNEEIQNILKASEIFFRKISYIFLAYIIVLCFIFPNFIVKDYGNLYTISLIIIISISTFAEYFFGMTYRLFLQSNQEAYVVSTIQIGTTLVNTVLVIILIKLGCNIQVVKLFSSLIFILRPILQNIYVKKKYNIDLSNADKNYKLKNQWDGLAQHIAAVIHSNTDVVVLTLFSTLNNVSIYSVYYMVVKGIRNMMDSLANGIDASFGDMMAKDELETLNKSFRIYEVIYQFISCIIFTCSLILIVPFVKVYTTGITDTNYIQPLFGHILILSEFVYAIRIPYNMLIKTAGHFKQTMVGAWVEAISNIVISVALVIKYGLVGVAIGTLIAMLYRTIEFMIYVSKNILKRSYTILIKDSIIMCLQMILLYLVISHFFVNLNVDNYYQWIIYAIITTIVVTCFVLLTSFVAYRKDFKNIMNYIKGKRKTN